MTPDANKISRSQHHVNETARLTVDRLLGESEKSFDELVDGWLDHHGVHHLEGDRGVRAVVDLVRTLNSSYTSLSTFLLDNPGAVEALVDWIKQTGDSVPEWAEALAEFGDEDEDGDGDNDTPPASPPVT